ncbi:MAG: hypothetical protein GXP26_12935 [Planctomycetes bacterium]|nr:hypothetical protein [Planctomycetota bacterium]
MGEAVDGFTTNESARIIGYTPDMLRGLKSHGLQPAGPNGLWSTALAVDAMPAEPELPMDDSTRWLRQHGQLSKASAVR